MTTNAELKKELEAMRAQLIDLSGKLEEGKKNPSDSSKSAVLDSLGAIDTEQLKQWAERIPLPTSSSQITEWLESLKRDVEESKTSALVAAFLAGVVAGRLLR